MGQTAGAMGLNDDLPPIVTNDPTALELVNRAVSDLSNRHGVKISYDRNGAICRSFARNGTSVFGAFDPSKTWASTVFGVVAQKSGNVHGTMQIAMYDLGNLSLAQYLRTNSLFKGGPSVELSGSAYVIASAIQGTVGFLGDAWVSGDYRSGTRFSQDWIRVAPSIAGLLAVATRAARGTFLFSRQAVMAKIDPPLEICTIGATWGGEERHLGWSSEQFIRAEAARIPAQAAQPTARFRMVGLEHTRTGATRRRSAG